MSVQIMYSCKGCGIEKRKISVPARNDGEDILGWVDKVMVLVASDHEIMAPVCNERKADIYLPADGDFIGQEGSGGLPDK